MAATSSAHGDRSADVVGYAYPWDVLGDPGFVDRVQALGVARVALAAAYHTTRAATPLHPLTRLVDAPTAALYRPVRPEAWSGRRLVPAAAEWVSDPDPFGSAARTLTEAGIEVAAWIVLTHSSRLGRAHPELTVVNCFDEAYPYALCPQSSEVREYAVTLAAESVRGVDCSAVVLEACGQLGLQHGGHHEKTDGAYGPLAQRLLSICCCAACRAAWRDRGLDADDVVARLRRATQEATQEATRTEGTHEDTTLPVDLLDTLLAVRHAATDRLRRSVVEAVRDAAEGQVEIVLHSQPDPWATGALPGLTSAAPDEVDVVVCQCWATGPPAIDTMRRLADSVAGRATAAAYVTVLPPVGAADFAPHLAALADAGMAQTHLYHLGLAGPARQPLLAEAVTASERPREERR